MLEKRIGLLIAVIVLIVNSGCAIVHHYGPYMGKVVDKETGEPLEGAAVLAVYKTKFHFIAGPVSYYLDVQETLTDKNGEFEIPSLTSFTFRPLHLFDSCPSFTIFKPGYGCFPRHQGTTSTGINEQWFIPNEYVVVKLPRLKTFEERISNVPPIDHDIPFKQQQNFVQVINQEHKNLGYGWYFDEESFDKVNKLRRQ